MSSSQDHRPTIRDVAKAAGVSTITVSRVAAGRSSVKASTRDTVLKCMKTLGYQPNQAARAMRTRETRTIGFLIPDLRNGLFAAVARAAEAVLEEAGYMLFIYSSERSTKREIEFMTQATQRGMDGLILSLSDETDSDVREALQGLKAPIVIWDRDIPGLNADVVFNEHAEPMREVTEQLIDFGHKNIALISASMKIRPGRERVGAFNRTIAKHKSDSLEGTVIVGPQSEEFGYMKFLELMALDPRPTALIVGGNDIFYGVMRGVKELSIQVPEQLSIIGTDDRLVSTLSTPPIAMIDRDMDEIGRTLAELLLERLGGTAGDAPRHRLLNSRIVEGASINAIDV